MQTNENLMSRSNLENTNVKNTQRDNLGNIKDLMIDCGSGRVL